MCFNTDGSFFCECQEGFIGDGLINCTGTLITSYNNNIMKCTRHTSHVRMHVNNIVQVPMLHGA
jgi:hypothetical protein